MPRGHSRGQHRGRHLLEPTRTASFQTVFRRRRLALLSAPLATMLVVGTGVVTSGFTAADVPGSTAGAASAASAQLTRPAAGTAAEERTLGTTRSTDRAPLVNNRVPKPKGKLWTTADLEIRTQPREKTRTVGLLDAGKRVPVTGRRIAGFAEVLVDRVPRWVTADYLAKKKEQAPSAQTLSGAPCPDGSSIEAGLQPAAIKVYRAVCAAFPELTTYGGQDGHGEHVNGEAIDFMVSGDTGQRVADFLYAKRAELDLFDIIWAQRIWTIQRSSEGFRPMSDRGSATANHFDHVHIKVN